LIHFYKSDNVYEISECNAVIELKYLN